ncbi:2-isopropylmalate synthase [Crenobacter cavernae]|uniref:2-isopropylmalate synthase n=1 Tax=Crenobacter cavernae TaxID=2290923 RepID=A0A345Y9B0_9NEIS|nr:2-isopropylmalate synthase [Crenobacter cavernae]AXK40512.1 2-isopropylmalate synthase [Crenobacter cavernae]
MLAHPDRKYRAFQAVALPDRRWPDAHLTAAPLWMSTDLRDGNQALIEPMNAEKKLRLFETLIAAGFKEIEVAFPSASQTDFDFVRRLIEDGHIPIDVTIEVLTQSRDELIERTFESLKGARRAIVHLYNAVAEPWRRIVFHASRDEVKAIAVRGAEKMKALADANPGTEWVFEYSPETFSAAEIDFALEVVDAVSEVWQPTSERKMIVNLPATVEMATPNTYADQIEWMHRNMARRDAIILSVHPHNDRGTGVAAAELALMAGAERVEGCLFGNGERTGNVDIVTLALNLYSQGVPPGLDFSDIDAVRHVAEECTGLPVHPRHPYVGDLVFTAFSGSHQDAIKKGMNAQKPDAVWEVPYLPIDPADLGRSYDAIIRVNSQSGKGGVSYLLQHEHGFDLPRRLQIEFSRAIQRVSDLTGSEVTGDDIFHLFASEYLEQTQPFGYRGHHATRGEHDVKIEAELTLSGEKKTLAGHGSGPLDAFVNALGYPIAVIDYHEHALGSGSAARAVCYIEMRVAGGATRYGVGVDKDIVSAALRALLSGLNRHCLTEGMPKAAVLATEAK